MITTFSFTVTKEHYVLFFKIKETLVEVKKKRYKNGLNVKDSMCIQRNLKYSGAKKYNTMGPEEKGESSADRCI